MSDRDFSAEMHAAIEDATSAEPYVPAIVAAEIVEKLRANDPDLLNGWLEDRAAHFVHAAINYRDHSRRSMTSHRKASADFADAVEAHEAGDSAPLTRYLEMRFTVEDGTRRQLGDLAKSDLEFVAGTYQDRANHNALRAEFMRALAAKVGKATVAEKFTEQQIGEMFSSIAA